MVNVAAVTALSLLLSSASASMGHYPAFAHRVAKRTKPTETISSANASPSPYKMTWQQDVANQLRDQLKQKQAEGSDGPLMCSVVGVPGSGKSTSCYILNDLLADTGCMVLPFDGYHYPLEYLKQLPNAADAIYRRGAPDTFDAQSLQRDLDRIKHSKEDTIHIPGFDHAKGDPELDAHTFCRDSTQIVLCEGLYLLHDDDGFESLREMFDASIFVDADVDMCVDRLKNRNQCIPGYTPEEVENRCEQVDRANAMTVERSKKNAHIVVEATPFF